MHHRVEKPEVVAEMAAAVTAVQCHPSLNTVVAVGMGDGTVCVLDCARTAESAWLVVSESRTQEPCHLEAVVGVAWQSAELVHSDESGSIASLQMAENWCYRTTVFKLSSAWFAIRPSVYLFTHTSPAHIDWDARADAVYHRRRKLFHPTTR